MKNVWVVLDREDPFYGCVVVEATSEEEAIRNGYEEWYGVEDFEEAFEALVAFPVPEEKLEKQ